jgi:sugar-specific transcriptional regulator TrmB
MQIAKRLQTFGVSEKQANLYLLLLYKGAKTLTELTELSDAVRGDVLDTLSGLCKLGMIEESVERPTKYFAAPIETALNAAIMKHARNLRRMERSKQEIIDLVNSELQLGEAHPYSVFK